MFMSFEIRDIYIHVYICASIVYKHKRSRARMHKTIVLELFCIHAVAIALPGKLTVSAKERSSHARDAV